MMSTGIAIVLMGCLLAGVLMGCAGNTVNHARERPGYAIVIHGGVGTMERAAASPQQRDNYLASLRAALTVGRDVLANGGSALDACEQTVRILEDDPLFNAGKGAVFTEAGRHELDASIMDGSTLKCGAVAGVRTVKHPISLARLVMTRTRHVLLAADGAEAFADETAVERVPNSYFDTDHRRESLEKVLEERRKQPQGAGLAPAGDDRYFGTVGCVALDNAGNLAAATSTGGLTAKKWGRVGDSPIIGAGNYADNATCAVSCTGAGEQFIRHGVAREIAAMMRYKGSSANAAAEEMIFRRLNIDDGGVIVVSKAGEIAMVFSTEGMYRGAADASGRFEVGIWKETVRE